MKRPSSHRRTSKFRFYCDEGFPVPAGKYLQSLGHNVEFVTRRGVSDPAQLAYAIKQERILLSTDKDFKGYTFSQEMIARSHGILVIQYTVPSLQQYQMILEKALKSFTNAKVRGKVCYASVNKTRYRSPLS